MLDRIGKLDERFKKLPSIKKKSHDGETGSTATPVNIVTPKLDDTNFTQQYKIEIMNVFRNYFVIKYYIENENEDFITKFISSDTKFKEKEVYALLLIFVPLIINLKIKSPCAYIYIDLHAFLLI